MTYPEMVEAANLPDNYLHLGEAERKAMLRRAIIEERLASAMLGKDKKLKFDYITSAKGNRRHAALLFLLGNPHALTSEITIGIADKSRESCGNMVWQLRMRDLVHAEKGDGLSKRYTITEKGVQHLKEAGLLE